MIYGFNLLDHDAFMSGVHRMVSDDYVGKTRQRGRGRENQHRDDKPWEDLIVGSPHRLWEGICDEEELDRQERKYIQEKCPRMNDKDNRWNPQRIEYEEQVRQRHQRDGLLGRQRWKPLEQRRRESLLEWDAKVAVVTAPPRWWPSAWRPWAQKAVLWLLGWLSVAVLVWGELGRYTSVGGWWRLGAAALLGLLALVWGVLRTPDSWRLWKRRFKGVWRWMRRRFRNARRRFR